jgi:excisionase family DNA binding protein
VTPSSDPSLTVHDVARRFSVPVTWVYSTAEAGKLAHTKIGRYLRFSEHDLAAYLAAQRRDSRAE